VGVPDVLDVPLFDLAARVIERDEDSFRHSSLNRALKFSTCAFWIGLPGSLNCSPRHYHSPLVEHLTQNPKSRPAVS
jgi:hypothetical protein